MRLVCRRMVVVTNPRRKARRVLRVRRRVVVKRVVAALEAKAVPGERAALEARRALEAWRVRVAMPAAWAAQRERAERERAAP